LREAIADAIDGISCPTCRPSGITAGRFGRPSSPTSCSTTTIPRSRGALIRIWPIRRSGV